MFLAIVGAGLVGPAVAAEPAPLGSLAGQTVQQPSANQFMADRIATGLRQNVNLRNFAVTVTYVDGVVDLSGTVADQPQREEVLRQVQSMQGVDRVIDHMTIGLGASIKQVQGPGSEAGPTDKAPILLAPPPDFRPQPQLGAEGRPGEPVPIFQAPPPSMMDVGTPRMPPYAWPTYAPYNNFSRVAYPMAYPYSSWPFIGPFYPFPKVPPGWRSVRLEWEDGHWWFSKTACAHDWWHLRFW